jgi:HSP20 family protein
MKELEQALEDVKSLHEKVLGRSAPDLGQREYFPFPFGVDPLQHALFEARRLKEMVERMASAPQTSAWMPVADCLATPDEFLVRLEVPGISREDLKVFVVDGECIVRGERKRPQPIGEVRPVTIERPWGKFERRFVVPVGGRPEEMRARVSDGVLELRVPVGAVDVPKEQEIVVS